jgi:hypothetical protein
MLMMTTVLFAEALESHLSIRRGFSPEAEFV